MEKLPSPDIRPNYDASLIQSSLFKDDQGQRFWLDMVRLDDQKWQGRRVTETGKHWKIDLVGNLVSFEQALKDVQNFDQLQEQSGQEKMSEGAFLEAHYQKVLRQHNLVWFEETGKFKSRLLNKAPNLKQNLPPIAVGRRFHNDDMIFEVPTARLEREAIEYPPLKAPSYWKARKIDQGLMEQLDDFFFEQAPDRRSSFQILDMIASAPEKTLKQLKYLFPVSTRFLIATFIGQKPSTKSRISAFKAAVGAQDKNLAFEILEKYRPYGVYDGNYDFRKDRVDYLALMHELLEVPNGLRSFINWQTDDLQKFWQEANGIGKAHYPLEIARENSSKKAFLLAALCADPYKGGRQMSFEKLEDRVDHISELLRLKMNASGGDGVNPLSALVMWVSPVHEAIALKLIAFGGLAIDRSNQQEIMFNLLDHPNLASKAAFNGLMRHPEILSSEDGGVLKDLHQKMLKVWQEDPAKRQAVQQIVQQMVQRKTPSLKAMQRKM